MCFFASSGRRGAGDEGIVPTPLWWWVLLTRVALVLIVTGMGLLGKGCAGLAFLFLLATPAGAEEEAELLTEVPAEVVWAPSEMGEGDALGAATPLDDPSQKALEHFYGALKRVERGEGKARVVVYGASHMACDSFTQHLRRRLQKRFGDGGPGFVVGAKPWRNYNHRDVTISYEGRWRSSFVSRTRSHPDGLYGLAGVSWASDRRYDVSRFATRSKGATGRRVSEVEVYYWKQPKGGDFYVTLDGKRKRVRTRSRKAKPGYARFTLPDGPHSVELRPRGNGEVRFFGVSMERSQPGVVVDTLGINGARAQSHLEWRSDVYEAHLARRKPDLLIMAYGTNATGDKDDPIDAYEARLDRVLLKARAAAGDASCVYVGPSDRPLKVGPMDVVPELAKKLLDHQGRTLERKRLFPAKRKGRTRRAAKSKGPRSAPLFFLPRPRQAQVIAAQKRVALKHGCAYWDWNAMMGGDLSMIRWVHAKPRMAAKDYVHHNRGGYKRAADLFWDALMGGYDGPPQGSP